MDRGCRTCKHGHANNGGHSCDLIAACAYSNQWEPAIKYCPTCAHSHTNNGTGKPCSVTCDADYSAWEPVEITAPEDTNHYDGHYQGTIQPIEVMQEHMTHEEFIGFLKGNIIKYTCRMGKKDAPDKEATKIHRYAEWLEKAAKGEKIDPRI